MPLILLIIGLILIVYSCRAIKLEDKKKQEEDSARISFRSVLQNNKEELNDYKIEIGILRRDIAESLTELQEEILDIKNNINLLKNSEVIYENKEELEKHNFLNKNDDNNLIYKDSNNDRKSDENEEENNIINKIDENQSSDLMVEDGVISEIDFSQKVDSDKTYSIKKLLNEGLTEEEICHQLSVSKGEVLLVRGLFKK